MTCPLSVDADLIAALRHDLEAADYRVGHLAQVLGEMAVAALERENGLPALLAARRSDDRAALVARLLTFGEALAADAVDRALPALGIDGAIRLGLLRRVPDGRLRAAIDLRPVDIEGTAWWLASDLDSSTTDRPVQADHVLGLGGASRTLAELTIRTPVTRALDLGTGSGIQALTLAGHSAAVVATDVSERALAFTAFNAALNGIDLQLRAGSMLQPVAGEQFDLVVSNPPFVITPRSGPLQTYTYRDGGRRGDDLVADLIRGVGDVLVPGGVAQLLGNWEIGADGDWAERVRGWLVDSGLHGWVIQREVLDPAHYVETWLRDGGIAIERDPAAWRAAALSWLADFDARAVGGVGFGYVILRKPTRAEDPLRHRLEELTGPLGPALGSQIEHALAMAEFLAETDDAVLADLTPEVAPDVTEERHLRPGAGDPEVILLRQGGGLRRVVRAGTWLAAVVGACDGELTLGQITAAVALLLDDDPVELRAGVYPQLRELLVDGLLTLSPAPGLDPIGHR
ncbi:MAG: methyltransferase [Beutenbergiaceae bacterium]